MAYPTPYTRQYDFQAYQNANPTRPLPGDKVNADLNAVQIAVGQIVDFLTGVTRSDDVLANGVVSIDSLSAAVRALIATGSATFPIFTVSTSAPSGGKDGDVWFQVI